MLTATSMGVIDSVNSVELSLFTKSEIQETSYRVATAPIDLEKNSMLCHEGKIVTKMIIRERSGGVACIILSTNTELKRGQR